MHLIGIYLSLERLFICSFHLFPDKNRRYARIFENGFSQTVTKHGLLFLHCLRLCMCLDHHLFEESLNKNEKNISSLYTYLPHVL